VSSQGRGADDGGELLTIQRLLPQQRRRDGLQRAAVLAQEGAGCLIGIGDEVVYRCMAAVGGNSFIVAFTCGIVFAAATRHQFAEPTEFTQTLGTVLSLLVWAIFGAVLVPAAFHHTTDWRPIVYAVLSLTVVRMLPVALALIGIGLRPDTIALMGWFGPRGLVSVVFTLVAFVRLEQAGQPIATLAAVAWQRGRFC
jgi:NhaP-type Na+/H+ or K+/H+ antiporter